MKSKTLHLIILIFSAVYTISCHDDDPAPLRFYDNYYEVPMGGKRHLGIESGNGNYSVEIADTRIATAGVEYGGREFPTVAPGSGKKMGFTFNGGEMPFGILGH